MSNETEQNFSFPTTKHNLVYVKLHINKYLSHMSSRIRPCFLLRFGGLLRLPAPSGSRREGPALACAT